LSFDIFENRCHATRAARLTPKYFYDFYILERSVVRRERSIRHQNHFNNFVFEKGVSFDTSGRLDTKIILIILYFKKECRATQTVD